MNKEEIVDNIINHWRVKQFLFNNGKSNISGIDLLNEFNVNKELSKEFCNFLKILILNPNQLYFITFKN